MVVRIEKIRELRVPWSSLSKKEKTLKVKMKEDNEGAPDGIEVKEYKKGEVYDLPESLAKPWIKQGIAEKPKAKKAPDNKAIKEAPENKAKK